MGTILKNNVIESVGAKATRFSLADVREEASAIIHRACDELDKARAEAREIIDRANSEAQTIKENARLQAHQEGHAQGLIEGEKKGTEQAFEQAKVQYSQQSEKLRNTLENVLVNFESQRDHLLAEAHQDLIALSLGIAAKIIYHQLKIDPQIAIENIKAAVGLVASRSAVVVKMNPEDIKRFELLDQEKASKLLQLEHIKIVADESVEVGGCIVQTENGKIDAQVRTQIDNIIRQLSPDLEAAVKSWV